MIVRKIFLFLQLLPCLCTASLLEQFTQKGHSEICVKKQEFDALYQTFDEFIAFLHHNPHWAQKLHHAKERFIRSKERNFYSTDFFGFFDESRTRGQIAFYYSTHFHEYILAHFAEFNQIPEIAYFFEACLQTQKPCEVIFKDAAVALRIEEVFPSQPPILLKVMKYFPSYVAVRPHYDGSALSLFLDSTDNQALLLSSYKSAFTVDDFTSPLRECSHSFLLIPGTLLTEFAIDPTPHIVLQSGFTRYAAIAFAMRPNFAPQKCAFSPLPKYEPHTPLSLK